MQEIHESWNNFLLTVNSKEIINCIKKNNDVFYPNEENIFKFMKNDLSKIKYVLYGQDPYVGINKDGEPFATGDAFKVNGLTSWQQSTKKKSVTNILKSLYCLKYHKTKSISEIRKELLNNEFILPPDQLFESWEKQGVLLLNYSLTVGDKPGSHFEYWDDFSKKLIMYMMEYNPNIRFILWGNDAQNFFSKIINDDSKIYKDVHPVNKEFYEHNKTFKKIKDINWYGI